MAFLDLTGHRRGTDSLESRWDPQFRGISINPLDPTNFSYLVWLLMGYMVVSAVLVVTAGRLGDIYGRTRVYNLGFAIFTLSAVGLSLA